MFIKKAFVLFVSCFFLSSGFALAGEKNSTPHFLVGDLGAKWHFGSDHLPVGVSVNSRHFVCWNILNKNYLKWIETNAQGLKESDILKENIPIHPDSSLTVREAKIVEEICKLAMHPKKPRSVIALEEVHPDVFNALQKALPSSFTSITTHKNDLAHGDVFFYDTTIFDFVDYIGTEYDSSHNTWMILTLRDKETGLSYTFVQSHVPGGEVSEQFRRQLADKCLSFLDGNTITLVMGDQNRSPDYFYEDLVESALEKGKCGHPFTILSIPYPTHINTLKEASWIDNIFIADPLCQASTIEVSRSQEDFFEELGPVISLLWDHFPWIEQVRKTQEALPKNEKIQSLFQKLSAESILYSLECEQFDLEKVLKAVEFAAEKHAFQTRKDEEKTPYIVHPLQVASNLWEIAHVRNADILIASLLHDTLEDTDAGEEEIEALFGKRVLQTVQEVTNDPSLTTEENKKRQVEKVPAMSQDARLIKLADRLANVRDLKITPPAWSQEKIESYLDWAKKLLKALRGTNERLERALLLQIKQF